MGSVVNTTEPIADDSASLAGRRRPHGESEHVRTFRMVGAALTLLGRQLAIRINLPFESPQERLASGPGPGAPVEGAAPRDFRRDAPLDVLGYRASPPSVSSRWVAGVGAAAKRKRTAMSADTREACACACATALAVSRARRALTEHPPQG